MSRGKSSTRRKFTRMPKMEELVSYGVPLRAIPTYLMLSDHAGNKDGKTNVSIKRIAKTLKVHRRTIERHLSDLEAAGVIRRQYQRRTQRGRFSSCLCVVISFALFTVRHQERSGPRREKNRRTKPSRTTPLNPPEGTKEAREKRKAAERRWREAQLREIGADV